MRIEIPPSMSSWKVDGVTIWHYEYARSIDTEWKWWTPRKAETMQLIQIDACAYCGKPSKRRFAMTRDGVVGPALPLCHDCGAYPRPSLSEIWTQIAMADDDGILWPERCPVHGVMS